MADNTTSVTLKVKDFEEREVYSFDYSFDQATGVDGQIDGNPRGGCITVVVKAMNDGNNQLLQWMLEPDTARDVEIISLNTKDGSVKKTVKATTAYCCHFKENWIDRQMHTETITLTCQTLSVGTVEFKNKWA
ncbi:MAG: hypothetical protein MJY76_01370 [Bacteroidales bacterium]|nr:hypothetical protein [Bacteroidales bacterium]